MPRKADGKKESKRLQKRLSIMSGSLDRQLIFAFALMTMIPVLGIGFFVVVYLTPDIMIRENVFLVVVISLVLSFLGFAIPKRTAKSISRLKQYLEIVAGGDLTRKCEIRNGTEIDSIGRSINSVLEKLQRDQQELQQFSERLEEKVQERTAELRKAREEIEKARDYADSIIKNMIDTLIVIDPKGKIKTVNAATIEVLGYKEEELIGKPAESIFEEEEEEEEEELFKGAGLQKLIEEGSIRDHEMTYKAKSGERIPVSFSGSVLRDKEGKLVGIIGVARDITERKRAEEQLLHSERLGAVGELAAGVAHEIRNPLSNITASAQFSLDKCKLNEEVEKHIKVILRNSERANRIIKDLLDFAKPREVSFKLGHIGDVIDRACNLVKTRCSGQRVRITRRHSGKLRRIVLIVLDEKRLEQAFLNFIMNALDAMPDGGRLTITVSCDSENGEVVVGFSDTGSGIPPEHLDKIVDPFFTTREDGTGLGLSLACRIIDQHKGTIDIRSKVGEGTEVIVRLPVDSERKSTIGS